MGSLLRPHDTKEVSCHPILRCSSPPTQSLPGQLGVAGAELDTEPVAAQALGDGSHSSGAKEWIEDQPWPDLGGAAATGDEGTGLVKNPPARGVAPNMAVPTGGLALAENEGLARTASPWGIAGRADPQWAGGQNRTLNQAIGEGGEMGSPIVRAGQLPDVSRILTSDIPGDTW